jgi:hypothetical protein
MWICPTTDWLPYSPSPCPTADTVQVRRRFLVTASNASVAAEKYGLENMGEVLRRITNCDVPALQEERPCPASEVAPPAPPAPPPEDCIVSAWSAWGDCSKPCGGGTRTRSRSILKREAFGGQPCPATEETKACNTQACPGPIDCQVSEWGEWGPCSKACGGGTQQRSRVPIVLPQYGGRDCRELFEMQQWRSCNPIPCDMTEACYASYLGASACQQYERFKALNDPEFLRRGRSACQSQLPAGCRDSVPRYF